MNFFIKALKIKSRSQLYRPLSFLCLLGCAMLMLSNNSFSQEKKKVILDGTEGEVMEPIDSSSPKRKRIGLFNYDLRFTTLKIGGGFLVDYSSYSQDKKGEDQMDTTNIELPVDFNPLQALRIVGYNITKPEIAIQSYKIHFVPQDTTKMINDADKKILFDLVKKYQ